MEFLMGPFSSDYALGNTLARMAPLMMVGLGAALCFRLGLFNLGGEGLVYLGALAGFLCLRLLSAWPIALALPLAIAFVCALSFAYAATVWPFERLKPGGHMIASFLLSQTLIPALDWVLSAKLDDPGDQLVASPYLAKPQLSPSLLPPSALGPGFALAILACLGLEIFLRRSRRGYELRMLGANGEFARANGLPSLGPRLLAFGIGSALMGIGGFLAMWPEARVIRGFHSGLGWSGLACAIVARSEPMLVIPAAFLFSFLESGSQAAQIAHGLPLEISTLAQALVFLFAGMRGPWAVGRGGGAR